MEEVGGVEVVVVVVGGVEAVVVVVVSKKNTVVGMMNDEGVVSITGLLGVRKILKDVEGVLENAKLLLGAAAKEVKKRLLDERIGVVSAFDEAGSVISTSRLELGLMSDWLRSEDEFWAHTLRARRTHRSIATRAIMYDQLEREVRLHGPRL